MQFRSTVAIGFLLATCVGCTSQDGEAGDAGGAGGTLGVGGADQGGGGQGQILVGSGGGPDLDLTPQGCDNVQADLVMDGDPASYATVASTWYAPSMFIHLCFSEDSTSQCDSALKLSPDGTSGEGDEVGVPMSFEANIVTPGQAEFHSSPGDFWLSFSQFDTRWAGTFEGEVSNGVVTRALSGSFNGCAGGATD